MDKIGAGNLHGSVGEAVDALRPATGGASTAPTSA